MSPARTPLRLWLVGLSVFLFLAGIVFRVSASSGFTITSPAPNAVLTGQLVTLDFSLPDYLKIVDYRIHPRAIFGQGHIHLWVDETPSPATAIHITSASYSLTNLKYGSHTAVAELVTNDHASIIPKTTATLNFTTIPPSSQTSGEKSESILFLSVASFLTVSAALYLVSFYKNHLSASRHTLKSKSKRTK